MARPVHDRASLALANVQNGAAGMEDDLDGLECIGDNDATSWVGGTSMLPPGNLHARVPSGTNGKVPTLGMTGRAANEMVAFGIQNGLAGAPCPVAMALAPAVTPVVPGFDLLVDPSSMVLLSPIALRGNSPSEGAQLLKVQLPSYFAGLELVVQSVVIDPAGAGGAFAASNAGAVRVQ